MQIKKIKKNYYRYGLINFLKALFKKFNINLNILDSIQKKRSYLSKELETIYDDTIADGLYKGTRLIKSNKYFLAKSAQILGCYEEEVQNEIQYLKKKFNFKNLINLGAGEGYHSVGCLNSKIIEYSISFEMIKKNCETIKKNFLENNLQNNFIILSKAEKNFLDMIPEIVRLNESLFLFDIEGDEFKILDNIALDRLKYSTLIIEFHHFYCDSASQKILIQDIQRYFDIKWIKTQSRNFSNFKKLDKFNDDEKWLMMSESRPETMQWLVCEPKVLS